MAGTRRQLPFVLLAALSGACYTGPEGAGFGDGDPRDVVMNTTALNGISLQGISLQGISLQGISLQGISLQGISLQGISLQGTVFSGFTSVNGVKTPREGTELIGAEWTISVQGKDKYGKNVTEQFVLRVDDIYPDPKVTDEDVLLYEMSYRPKNSQVWDALCKNPDNSPIPAIPLNNYWDLKTGDRVDDDRVVTFACTNGVLAKCVEWGYRPWGEAWTCPKWDKPKNCDLISLQDHHQACTRMARADYCGTGEPWTVNGTAIDIWDHLYPQIEAREAPTWQIEAEWSPEGAECLLDIRQQGWKAMGQYPSCPDKHRSKAKKDCGQFQDDDTLLVSAFNKPK